MNSQLNYLKNLALTSTAKNTYLTTFGAGLNAIFGFIFTILVARSISPADFGLFSVIFNFGSILFVICDLGLSSAILRYLPRVISEGKEAESNRIIKFSFLTSFIISSVIAGLLFVFSSPIAKNIFIKQELTIPLAISALALVGLTLSVIFTSVLQAQKRFAYGVITDSSIIFIKLIFTIILLISGNINLLNVVIIYSLTTFSGLLIGFFFITPKFLFVSTDRGLAKILLGFGAWIMVARIANIVAAKLDTLMLIRYVEATEVGFYAAAQKMTFVIPVLLNGLLSVIAPMFSSIKTKKKVLSFMKKSSLFISIILLPMFIIYMFSSELIVLIYGVEYQAATVILRWLLISSFFLIISNIPVLAIVYYLGRSKDYALISLVQLLLIFIGNLIFIPKYGVIGPAISLTLAYLIYLLICVWILWRGLKDK